MDMFDLALVNLTKNKLDYLSERQKVIASNVANVNTPGYVAKDIQEPDFASQVKEVKNSHLQMRVTNPKHIARAPSFSQTYQTYTPQPDTALTIDGNGVNLEEQLNEASKIKSEHEKALTIYNKYKSLMQTASTKINV